LQKSGDKLRGELATLTQKTIAPPPPINIMASMMHAEIRSTLAAMTQADRLKQLAEAANTIDADIMGAALHGPSMLTNLAPVEREHIREMWRRKAFPTECSRIGQLVKALVHVERGGKLLLAFWTGCSDAAVVESAKAAQDNMTSALGAPH
jgi:hypothetical protein